MYVCVCVFCFFVFFLIIDNMFCLHMRIQEADVLILQVMNLGGFSPPRPACPRLSLGNDHKESFALPLAQYYPKIVYPVPISKMVYPLARLHQSNVSALGYEAGSSTNASSIRDVDLFGSLNRADEQFNTCQQVKQNLTGII